MQESPFYKHVIERGIEQGIEQGIERGIEQGIERGIEQGARQTNIDNTLATLEARFPEADLSTLKPRLEAIADLDQLKQISLNASLATSFQHFQEKMG